MHTYHQHIQEYKFVRIDGRTPSDVRQHCCDQFQHDEECRVAVLSITAANSGEWCVCVCGGGCSEGGCVMEGGVACSGGTGYV